ncbi:S41 family peptidase [Labilibaculum sp.]|uniref:S41 family peptidase n=1 Tax=Labilibaculum sp. TaxID=2060723 RepID=UPI00356927F1
MRKLLFIIPLILLFSCAEKKNDTFYSTKKNIKVLVNGKQTDWSISPKVNPDRLNVYCTNEKNEVIFQTDTDTVSFMLSNNDTTKFKIILNSVDTAYTEIVGIKELPNKITDEEKLYWLSQTWSETKYNFVNVDQLTFDLDSLYKELIPEVLASKNDYEYYRILRKFTASLKDGHTQVSDRGQFYAFTDYIPITLQDFNEKIYITHVRKNVSLDSTWLGAELIEIEAIPTVDYLEKNVFPYISASTEQHLWMQSVYKIQSGFKNKLFKGTIRKVDGTIEKIELKRNGEATRTPNDEYWGVPRNFSRSIVDLDWTDNNIAVISFNRFTPQDKAIKEFDEIARKIGKAKGVVIDLRKNGGGSTGVAWHLQKYLTKGNSFLNYAWETRINDGVRKANGNWKDEYKDYYLNQALRFEKPKVINVSDTLKRIKCPTTILVGRYTFSAAEDFLVNIFEVPGRPKIIGEETGGSTGSPLVVRGLPGGGYARICTRRICYPISKKRFVNSGVKPDIEVKQTIDDYLNGRDVVLERAIEEIKK